MIDLNSLRIRSYSLTISCTFRSSFRVMHKRFPSQIQDQLFVIENSVVNCALNQRIQHILFSSCIIHFALDVATMLQKLKQFNWNRMNLRHSETQAQLIFSLIIPEPSANGFDHPLCHFVLDAQNYRSVSLVKVRLSGNCATLFAWWITNFDEE